MYGAALGAVMGIGQAALNNEYNRQNLFDTAQLNYEYGEKAAGNADKRTRALYEDLYSPQAKVKQLQDAGLSVGLMYGGAGGAGGQSSTAGAQGSGASGQAPIPYSMDIASNVQAMAQAKLAQAQARKLNADAKVTEETGTDAAKASIAKMYADAGLAEAAKTQTELQTKISEWDEKLRAGTFDMSLQQFEYETKRLQHLADLTNYQSRSAEAQAEVDEKTVKSRIENLKLQNDNLFKALAKTNKEIEKMSAEIDTMISNVQIAWKNADTLEENMHNAKKQLEAQITQWTKQNEQFYDALSQKERQMWINAAVNVGTTILHEAAGIYKLSAMKGTGAGEKMAKDVITYGELFDGQIPIPMN